MTLVIDASVIIKWLFDDPEHEDWTRQATDLMAAAIRGDFEVLQPPHWLPEVAAVLAREAPVRAHDDIRLLCALDLPERSDPAVLDHACRLSIALGHHLFDTLYHALALESEGTLVTADDRYHRKAAARPGILHLGDWVGLA